MLTKLRELLFPGSVIRDLRKEIAELKRKNLEERVARLEQECADLSNRWPYLNPIYITSVRFVDSPWPNTVPQWTNGTMGNFTTCNWKVINGGGDADAVANTG